MVGPPGAVKRARVRGVTEPARTPSVAVRALRFGAGAALVAAGLPMLILPGPGLLAIGGGLYLMSDEIPALGRPVRAIRARRSGHPGADET